MNSKHFIWMPLIGFDKNQPDKGVDEYIKNAGYTPGAVSVFLFHPDIINEHENMDKEFVLHPDCCSYYGVPANEFRRRQPWTNYDLRELAHSLEARGINGYIGVDGVYLENTKHYEWQSDHLELLSYGVNGRMNLNVLKRFKDGTYYEDFFADKIEKCLTDYGFSGLHVSDFFCPPEHSISNGDFSSDLLEQFISHSGVTLPDDLMSRMDYDEQEDIIARQKYIWGKLRREWIDFYAWRWEKFWTKICSRIHALGKKVMINNAWCADPFEALYRYGIDYRRFYKAGVDYLVAETVPTGGELIAPERGPRFHRFMTMPQCMKVFNPQNKLLTLLGVKDCTEEWDVLHHAPMRLEKDMYTLATNYINNNGEYICATDGYMVTLGDGITSDEWKWLSEREKLAFEKLPEKILAPTVIWSDAAHYAMLDDYIETRRPSLHKQVSDLKSENTPVGSFARIDNLDKVDGNIFVPNFDLLTEDEKEAVLSYKKGAVFATCPAGYAKKHPELTKELCFEDSFAHYSLCAFALNVTASVQTLKDKVSEIFKNGEMPNVPDGNPKDWFDAPFFNVFIPSNSSSDVFVKSLSYIMQNSGNEIFTSDAWMLPVLLENGVYRIYVYNVPNAYKRYEIMSKRPIQSVKPAGKYPVMPPKFVVPPKDGETKFDGAKADAIKIGLDVDEVPFGFIAKVPPGGIAVFDVTLQ